LRQIIEQQIEERALEPPIQRRGRLVRHHDLRRPDQGAGGGHALLLAYAQRRCRLVCEHIGVEPQAGQQPARLRLGRPGARHTSVPSFGEAQRQQHVVQDRQIGQQIEHLEDDAEVLGPEAIAPHRRHAREVVPEHHDPALHRRHHAA
jgi:hypothetical protein